MSREIPGAAFHIFGYDFEDGLDLGLIVTGYNPDYLQSYNDYYCHKNVWAAGWIKLDPGRPTYSEQMCAHEDLMKSEFYNDWIKPQENISAGGGIMLSKNDQRMFVLGGNIRRKDAEVFEGPWIRLLAHLKPHLETAFQINRMLLGQSLAQNPSQISSGRSKTLTFVINDRGRIVHACEAGAHHLMVGELVKTDTANRVMLDEAGADNAFRQVQNLVRRGGIVPPQTYVSRNLSSAAGHSYKFIPFNGDASIAMPLGLVCGVGEKCILILIAKLDGSGEAWRNISNQYCLTLAETQVAKMVVDGLSSNEIAKQRGTSVITVRNQIKSIMSKSGVRRRLEFIRLVERG